MNVKNVITEGSKVPWRLSEDKLIETLNALPINIRGTEGLSLKASVVLGGLVRIIPIRGKITEYSLNNIRNSKIYPENGATYVLFKYHGVSYELGTASPFSCLTDYKIKKKK